MRRSLAISGLLACRLLAQQASADDQTKTGAGNTAAIALAQKSPMVRSAYQFLQDQAKRIKDSKLRTETLDAIGDHPCVRHRANLTDAQKDAILQKLLTQGLVNPATRPTSTAA